MAIVKKKKILVGIDGSENSQKAVEYIGRSFSEQNVEIVLFHAMRNITEVFFDMGISPLYHKRILEIRGWESEQRKAIREFMEKARKSLRMAGIADDRVKIKMHPRKVGIARDIIMEAESGYDAVVIGRKGVSKVQDLVLGGTANKLIQRLTQVPVLVVGERPAPEKILIGIDSSDSCMNAVDFIGSMFGSSNVEILLVNVVLGMEWFAPEAGHLIFTGYDEMLKEAKTSMSGVFEDARARLINAGFMENKVAVDSIHGVSSRAAALVERAREGGFGTIVVGRRGLSRINDFFMGRVSNKVLQLAKEMAVWIVN